MRSAQAFVEMASLVNIPHPPPGAATLTPSPADPESPPTKPLHLALHLSLFLHPASALLVSCSQNDNTWHWHTHLTRACPFFFHNLCCHRWQWKKIIFREILISGSNNLDQKDPPLYCSIIHESTHFHRVGAALTSYNSCLIKGVRAAHFLCEAILSFPKENTSRAWNKPAWQVETRTNCPAFPLATKLSFYQRKDSFVLRLVFNEFWVPSVWLTLPKTNCIIDFPGCIYTDIQQN